jgi:aspartate aminotransferase
MSVLTIASGFDRLGTETAFGVLAQARALEQNGGDVVHLEIGEPDFPTADHIAAAVFTAVREGDTRYCASAGISELRAVAASYLSDTRDVSITPDNVLVGTGAKLLLFLTVLATCGPGDEAVYPVPGYPIYESAIRWAGATPVPLSLRRGKDFAFSGNELAAVLTSRTKLVVINSPHNPTGAILSPAQLDSIAEVVRGTNAWILSDEVYSCVGYETPFCSIASIPDMLERTVMLDSMSKTYAMTGWRCGYAAVPDALVEPVTHLIVNSTSCVPPFIQRAAIAALTGPQDAVETMRAEFQRRRDLTVERLNRMPRISCSRPAGAFYVYPRVSEAEAAHGGGLADRLLTEAGVAALPGAAFGDPGSGHLRLSFAASPAQLSAALDRIEQLLRPPQDRPQSMGEHA